ncbi:hypothetical protein EU537_09740 [Candidatus Thorarchaeota archaeon]|nr:MAG: hypothetical protein EU537_09740 [Candidatus Thorarchaeota archaeon]
MEWLFDDIHVSIEMGPYEKNNLGFIVKSEETSLDAGLTSSQKSTLGISIQEVETAENVEYWPKVTMQDPNRREKIFKTTMKALRKADRLFQSDVGILTFGLEAGHVPSWEIAEEIGKAIFDHSKSDTEIERILLIPSSPTQVSSFQYVLDNITVIR